jgi:hypothetical protein
MNTAYYKQLVRSSFLGSLIAAVLFSIALYLIGIKDIQVLSLFAAFILIGGSLLYPFSPLRVRDNIAITPAGMFMEYRKLFPNMSAVSAVLLGCFIFLVSFSVLALLFVQILYPLLPSTH